MVINNVNVLISNSLYSALVETLDIENHFSWGVGWVSSARPPCLPFANEDNIGLR